MPAVQDFSVPAADDMDVTFNLDPTDNINLLGARVRWAAFEQAYGQPGVSDFSGGFSAPVEMILKDSDAGGVSVLESPPDTFVVHLVSADTLGLLANYYHEAQIIDINGNRATVVYGTMTVTQTFIGA